MLLLDSATLPARERSATVASLMSEASEAAVTLVPHEEPDARMELWQLGRIHLFRSASSGMAMSRSEDRARRAGSPIIALAVQERSRARHEQFGHRRHVAPGQLMLVDLSAPFAFSWETRGASRALQIPADELALPADVVRGASARLADSPLSGLVTRHVVDLFRQADRLVDRPQAAAVGNASVELVRALLSSTAGERSTTRAVLHETLPARVHEYVRQNLRRPDLGPETVARAHNVSVRHLYQVLAGAGLSLEQLVISRRLAAAHAELGTAASAHKTIATVAREWGFRDPAHFGRRFKAEFGVTPREHRAARRRGSP